MESGPATAAASVVVEPGPPKPGMATTGAGATAATDDSPALSQRFFDLMYLIHSAEKAGEIAQTRGLVVSLVVCSGRQLDAALAQPNRMSAADKTALLDSVSQDVRARMIEVCCDFELQRKKVSFCLGCVQVAKSSKPLFVEKAKAHARDSRINSLDCARFCFLDVFRASIVLLLRVWRLADALRCCIRRSACSLCFVDFLLLIHVRVRGVQRTGFPRCSAWTPLAVCSLTSPQPRPRPPQLSALHWVCCLSS